MMLVARVGIGTITKFCKGPVGFRIDLANESGSGRDSSQSTIMRYVDFSK